MTATIAYTEPWQSFAIGEKRTVEEVFFPLWVMLEHRPEIIKECYEETVATAG